MTKIMYHHIKLTDDQDYVPLHKLTNDQDYVSSQLKIKITSHIKLAKNHDQFEHI
jgi:hypothetical protein